MPSLYLPADHTDADLILATQLAEIVGSDELFVAWSEEAGPGAPEVEAVLREPAQPVAEAFGEIFAGLVALLTAIFRPGRSEAARPPTSQAPRPAAEEPTQ
jgi:hypothetical protein